MKPYYDTDGIVIYHGDCRELLPSIGYCDLILSDPPYGIHYKTSWRSCNDELARPIANDKNLDVVAESVPLINASLNNNRHWYLFASPLKISEAVIISSGLGCGVKQILAWDKGDRGTVGDLTCGFGEAWEAILYGTKGRRPINGKRPRTVLRYDWSGTMDPVHPMVKPIPLLKKLILMSSNKSEMIFDPYMGSGTTLRAAKDLGRRAIGIELEERYCEIAANRLSQTVIDFGVEP